MKKYKVVIFDWDGTLMNTISQIVTCMHQSAEMTDGLTSLSVNAYKQTIGLSLEATVNSLYPNATDVQHTLWQQHYSELYVAADNRQDSQLYSGVVETLKLLQQQRLALAVATGKRRRGLNRAFQHTQIQDYFAVSRCADETASKPDPLMIHEVLAELGLHPDEALMVGDSVHDMRLANNAGVDVVGITWGVDDRETLNQYNPLCVIDLIEELLMVPGLANK
ncbi:HAD family hydrolase [Photobacterium frigidiphilum]|uniref:HAD family hydrolase n=1 Tax=Photobacterium frigidiphilum TaxID=264736 RepID=A0A2T3JQT3_9GAMM|nr:HAD-IA family hydrolase [Photobacterium frigidiphilum]PSU51444.1 HAD family hydrolase [Photobacterium frigidiphilum]